MLWSTPLPQKNPVRRVLGSTDGSATPPRLSPRDSPLDSSWRPSTAPATEVVEFDVSKPLDSYKQTSAQPPRQRAHSRPSFFVCVSPSFLDFSFLFLMFFCFFFVFVLFSLSLSFFSLFSISSLSLSSMISILSVQCFPRNT